MYYVKPVIRSKSRWLNPSFVGLVLNDTINSSSPYSLNIFGSKPTFGQSSRKFFFSAPTTSMEADFSMDVQSPLSRNTFRCKSTLGHRNKISDDLTYPKSFCDWLAGIIDGDGKIGVDEQNHAMLSIILGYKDLPLLRYIQHMLGGNIKVREGGNSYCYLLDDRIGMTKLMGCINGHIRHSRRLCQLHRVCQILDIPVILPITPDAQSNWFAGFFDTNGVIDIDMKHLVPLLSIRVANRLLQDVETYKVVFGGNIYYDSGREGYYQWSVHSRKDIITLIDYFKTSTFRSHKSRRFLLIEEYYRLYDLRAYKPESIYHKQWLAFLNKWNKY